MLNIPVLTYYSSSGEYISLENGAFHSGWNKLKEGSKYPHFDPIFDNFVKNFGFYQKFMSENYTHDVKIKDCEINYYNAIPVDNYHELYEWIDIKMNENFDFQRFNLGFVKSFSNNEGEEYAKIFQNLSTAIAVNGDQKAILFAFTFVTTAMNSKFKSVTEAFKFGQSEIAKCFLNITTQHAQEIWK